MTLPMMRLPAGLEALGELALDLRWAWSHASDAVWARVSPALWGATRNPLLMLQSLTHAQLQALAADDGFRALLADVTAERARWRASPGWFQRLHGDGPLRSVAFFSMEFGLSESLPVYSGGLGILAGDCLKTASDLQLPMTGIGLLWQQGYFHQSFDAFGNQLELYPYNDVAQLPVQPVADSQGDHLRVELAFPGRSVVLRAWSVQVGRVTLYLLDSNDPLNTPADRGITAELYGGGTEVRLQQELCLGVGGWLLLRQLGLTPQLCHLNEGHAAFAVLARAWSYMQDHDVDLRHALAATRAGNIFTTHTPVPAGIDQFPAGLVARYLGWARDALGVDDEQLLALGRNGSTPSDAPFNMAYLASRGSLWINGVSRLHGEVSRRMFQSLFPRWPLAQVPVTHVTNGVHVPTWDSPEADRLWTDSCGKGRWLGELEGQADQIDAVSDATLWEMRASARQRLIAFAREAAVRQLGMIDAPAERRAIAATALDPNALTLGFARRFTAYKRPNLLLAEQGRLRRLLLDRREPVQLVIAGKAHPQDEEGRSMVREWHEFIDSDPALASRVVFLADYDMRVAEQLVQGVDVWINTPRRPWEACGTSGMKTLVNGGLNLSVLDGWWAEAYAPEVGWAIGGQGSAQGAALQDQSDARQLLDVLEGEVICLFYRDRDPRGVPVQWLARVRRSMSLLTPQYSSNRMLREYIERLYLPAAVALQARSDIEVVAQLCRWQDALHRHWNSVHFGELTVSEVADGWRCAVPVYLDDLGPQAIAVELYAEPGQTADAHIVPMRRGASLPGTVNGFLYEANLQRGRPAGDYTPRIIPCHVGAQVPLEAPLIHWYR